MRFTFGAFVLLLGVLAMAAAAGYLVYWALRRTTAGDDADAARARATAPPAGAADAGGDDQGGAAARPGAVRTYAIRLDARALRALQLAERRPPLLEAPVYAACAASGTGKPRIANASYADALWLPLAASGQGLRLHQDVHRGRVTHLLLSGVVVRVWALPPSLETRGAVLLAVAPPDDAVVAGRDCTLARVLQPFELAADAAADGRAAATRARVQALLETAGARGGTGPLLSAWGF